MNILYLADNFPPERNAQASRVFERACYWVKWGHSVTVITCAPNYPEGEVFHGYKNRWYHVEEISGIRVVRVKTFIAPNSGRVLRVVDYLSFMLAAFLGGLIQSRPDVVAANSPHFFAGIAGCLLARVRGTPFLLEVADLWPASIVAVGAMRRSLALRLLERIELAMYRLSKRVVVLSPAFRDNLIQRGVPAAKIDVVINGVDLTRFAPQPQDDILARELGLASENFVVGYLGTIGMAHGLDNVLNAAQRCRPQTRFLLVGPGAERQRLVEEAALRSLNNVIFVPAQPKERMSSYWSLCDVALVHLKDSPLFGTVIPSKIFEAMAMGLPILLVSPEGVASEIIRREQAGIWVPAGQPEALSNAVEFLRTNPEYLRTLAVNSRAAAPRYSRERQATEMLNSLSLSAGLYSAEKARSASA